MTLGDPDLAPRGVSVRGPAGDEEWILTPGRADRNWSLILTSPDRTWTGAGSDCFKALRDLRAQLDVDQLVIGVNGARPNAWSSGMQCDMGEGRSTYLCQLGERTRPEAVRTLDRAPLESAGSVGQQDDFHARWLAHRTG